MRFLVSGQRRDPFTLDDDAGEMYIDAPNRDEAARKARAGLFVRIDGIRETPDHEGRGRLWRLGRWISAKTKAIISSR